MPYLEVILSNVARLSARQQKLPLPRDPYVATLEAKVIALYARIRATRSQSCEVPRAEAKVWAQARALYLAQQHLPEEPEDENWRADVFLRRAWVEINKLTLLQVSQLQHPSRARNRVAQQDVLDGAC